MTDIYFSCDAKDKLLVGLVGEAFVKLGYEVFWDQRPSQPDDVDWEVREHLEGAKCVIVFWSSASLASKKVKHEADIAEQAGKLISVLIESLAVQQLPLPFGTMPVTILSGWQGNPADGNWIELRRRVEAKIPRQIEPAARPAKQWEHARRAEAEARGQAAEEEIARSQAARSVAEAELARSQAARSAAEAELERLQAAAKLDEQREHARRAEAEARSRAAEAEIERSHAVRSMAEAELERSQAARRAAEAELEQLRADAELTRSRAGAVAREVETKKIKNITIKSGAPTRIAAEDFHEKPAAKEPHGEIADQLLKATGRLVENIPRRMRVGVSEAVEVRVGREELTSLMMSGLTGTADAKTHAVDIIESMSASLFAPLGGFEISGASPETQIVDAGAPSMVHGRWLWMVTPLRRGHHRLQICVSAQVKTKDGLPAHSTLPDQIIEIEVAVNYKSLAVQTGVVTSGAIASAFLGAIASDKWPTIREFVGVLFGK